MTVSPLPRPQVAYVAPRQFIQPLLEELEQRGEDVMVVKDRLVLARGVTHNSHPAWAQNVWLEPQWLSIDSISDAARQLKGIQRNWHLHSVDNHRRASLIAEKLPHVSAKPLVYGQGLPESALGAWTLWEPGLILASSQCSSPFPDGEPIFVEDKRPPSRAYLKLWETFTRLGRHPLPGELCLDLGACPGGWTWVLAQHGARVFSVDKAPLEPELARTPHVSFCPGSGFALDPKDVGQVDWLFSDMICYPSRLWELMERWLDQKAFRNAVCTLKFQGETDHAMARQFASVPGSQLIHLGVNRHELTWVLLEEG